MSLRVHYEILNQKGTPAFFSDTYANRPTYGYQGRVFISTDTGQIFEDTGSAWTLIADAGVGGGTLASVTANGNTTATGIIVTANGISANVLSINGNGTTTGDALLFPQFSASNTTYADRTSIWALNKNVLGIGFSQAAGSPKVINFNSDLLSQGTTETYYLPNSNGVLALGQNGLSGYNSNPNSAFSNSQFYSGVASPSESHTYNIGVTGTALANSGTITQWGVGVYGAGYTNGATRSAGVQGDGEVTASSDTGSAIGVRGYATATHSGGLNIGILGDALGSSTGNYGIYTNMASASNTFANYHLGTAVSYFGGNVGIGTSTPASKLTVGSDFGGGTGVTVPTAIQLDNTYKTGTAAFDNLKLYLFKSATETYGFNVADLSDLQYWAGSNASGMHRWFTTQTEKMRLLGNGNLLIGSTTDAGYKLQVNGEISAKGTVCGINFQNRASSNYFAFYANTDIYIFNTNTSNIATIGATTGVYTPLSDINRKKDFEISTIGLNAILNLKPTLYRMKEEDNTEKHLGFIAQEVKQYIPQAYVESGNFIGLNYQAIVATLVKSIQELNEKLERNNIN